MQDAHNAIVWFFAMLIGPTTVLIAANCLLVINQSTTEKFAAFMTRLTAVMLLISVIGCVVAYSIEWWDLLGIFSAAMLLLFISLVRVSLLLVLIEKPRT